MEKNKRDMEKSKKKMDREIQKEMLQSEKEQKRLHDEAQKEEKRREKEEIEMQKLLRRQQEEAEREKKCKAKEEAELKRKFAFKKQASLMEQFLKRNKVSSQQDSSLKKVTTSVPSSNSVEQKWDGHKTFLNLERTPLFCGQEKMTKDCIKSYRNFHFYYILEASHFETLPLKPLLLRMSGYSLG